MTLDTPATLEGAATRRSTPLTNVCPLFPQCGVILCANTGKQDFVGHLIDEFPLRFIVDQANDPASSFDELESLNVPPVLSFQPT
jgi:hypothetical protein